MFCHTLEKAHGVFEFWVIFHALGMDVSWGDCFFIFSVASTLDNALFFAQVGGMEAWVSSTLAWMGITRDGINITAIANRREKFPSNWHNELKDTIDFTLAEILKPSPK